MVTGNKSYISLKVSVNFILLQLYKFYLFNLLGTSLKFIICTTAIVLHLYFVLIFISLFTIKKLDI